MNKRSKSSSGITLIWLVIIVFGAITILVVGTSAKKQKEQKQTIITSPIPSSLTPLQTQLLLQKTPRLIAESPCARDLNSKECEDYIGEHCRGNPRTSDCLEAFHYAGTVTCEQNPNSQDCRFYQEHKDQARPATGLSKEMQDTLNRIRTFPLPFLDQPSFDQSGPKYTYDYEDYLLLEEEANFGHIYPGHPDYQYYQELQQQFGQPEIPPIYLNPLNDPNTNPLANPDINPLMNPDINPMANPDINPMADPSLNPGCIPCQIGGQQGFGQWGGYGGWGGFSGWRR